MLDTRSLPNDLCHFIGTDRDPNIALQRLIDAGILLGGIDDKEVLKIIENAFGRESALRKMREDRKLEAAELKEQLMKKNSVTEAEKSRWRSLNIPTDVGPPAHIHLVNDLEPYLSEKGQNLSQSYFDENLQRPTGSTELRVDELMASESAKLAGDAGLFSRPRFYQISIKWVPNKVLGAQMGVDDWESPYTNEGEVGATLEYGFIDGVRIYRTGIETVMRCKVDESLGGNSSDFWPRQVFNNVFLHSSQADAYYRYFHLLLTYDDRKNEDVIRQEAKPSQSEIDQLLADEHSSDMARITHDSIRKMQSGEEQRAAIEQFMREWNAEGEFYNYRVE